MRQPFSLSLVTKASISSPSLFKIAKDISLEDDVLGGSKVLLQHSNYDCDIFLLVCESQVVLIVVASG